MSDGCVSANQGRAGVGSRINLTGAVLRRQVVLSTVFVLTPCKRLAAAAPCKDAAAER